uniref:ExbD/TolR family protein n=1 Tax=Altererythrobacter segetis TaxID=1104773 RepID=UPI00140D6648|nr:biopolymer transporter ExbD [Altererythrobacter segetis]
MAMSGGRDDGQPMMEMNTTPLIDVMLVLLVMLIMTLPPVTNSVNIDLPTPSNVIPTNVDPVKNKIVLTNNDEILWNGQAINDGQLVSNLQQTLTFAVEPELQFEPEPNASYNISSQVLNIIKGSGVTKFGFVGNEKYRVFGKGGPADPTR